MKVPAGVDLGRTTHQEIAVAILAELVQLRASGALAGANGDGDTRGQGQAGGGTASSAGTPSPAEVIDPVCGMTVLAGPGGNPVEHDGLTYYFCCAGCRQEFEQNPAAYVTSPLPR